jgi:hypothetical protein
MSDGTGKSVKESAMEFRVWSMRLKGRFELPSNYNTYENFGKKKMSPASE